MNSALKYELEPLETLIPETLPKAREDGAGLDIAEPEGIKGHLVCSRGICIR